MAALWIKKGKAMIAGHFGFAALVKSREQRVPLWALMFATVWLDIVFIPLFLAGWEKLRPISGSHSGYGQNIILADYSHSLVGALALSAVLGLIFSIRWERHCGVVLALVAFSHWLLDLVVHRGDMPVLPGNLGDLPRMGFGLWKFRPGAVLAELALVVAGSWFYWRAARSTTASSNRGKTRALVVSALVIACGLVVLALDVSGLRG